MITFVCKIGKVLVYLLEAIGRVFALVWTQKMSRLWESVISHIYTGWLRYRFKEFGKDSLISYRAMNLKGLEHIKIGNKSKIGANVQLTAWSINSNRPIIRIGNNCCIRDNAHITAIDFIRIGDNLLTGTNVLISDNAHGEFTKSDLVKSPLVRSVTSKGGVTIGDNVWLGNNVCVLSGVTIGQGVVVGANSVVLHDVPDFTMVAGTPARVVKRLSEKNE